MTGYELIHSSGILGNQWLHDFDSIVQSNSVECIIVGGTLGDLGDNVFETRESMRTSEVSKFVNITSSRQN